ncbi:MAG: ABC transporter permease [Actinomycetota bacterium]|nr:MAG: ABC transporter permease [Actinomycetota bacterium]
MAVAITRARRRIDPARLSLGVVVAVIVVFLLAPIVAVAGSSLTSGELISFPPRMPLSLRWYREFLEDRTYRQALMNSVLVASVTAVLATVIGTMAALWYARTAFRLKGLLYYLLFMPFLVPGLVLGIGLSVGLEPVGLGRTRGTFVPVILGHLLWAMPLVFVVMAAVIRELDPDLEAAAASLGAPPLAVLRTITIPLLGPGLMASLILGFVISLHEFVMALFLTSSGTTTLPVVVWNSLRFEVRPIIAAIDSVMVGSVVVVLAVLGKLVGLEKVTPR